jgi:hypothetical protein
LPFCTNTTLAWRTGKPKGSVTVPWSMAAWVEGTTRRKRKSADSRKAERHDRTGMEILFSPGNEGGQHLDRRRTLFPRAEHVVTPGRLELPTNSLGNCCSIHLSYGATFITASTGSVYRKAGNGSACARYGRLKNIPKKGHPHRDLSTALPRISCRDPWL